MEYTIKQSYMGVLISRQLPIREGVQNLALKEYNFTPLN
jgi:hypothetical protein